MSRPILVLTLVAALFVAGCTSPDDDAPPREGPPEWVPPTPASAGCLDAASVDLDRARPVVTLETNFGDIGLEIFTDMVPITSGNFLDLVEEGYYDGTRFHRIMDDFMMQGGDPNTRDGPENTWGNGGPGYQIPDEFHHRLRHDEKGVLSMANSGPNTGGSQFFITFDDQTHLDDKHSVFGEVVSGMDVVDQVNAEAASSSGTPDTEVLLEQATVTYPDAPSSESFPLGLWTPNAAPRVGAHGGETGVLLMAVSCGARLVTAELAADAPDGVEVRIEDDFTTFDLPAAQRVAVAVTFEVDAGEPGPVTVPITLSAPDTEPATLQIEVQRDATIGLAKAERGAPVEAHYVGMLVDGRMFDTSYAQVAADDDAPRAATFNDRPRGDPFTFTPGGGVIEGFTELAVGTGEGTAAVGRMPPAKAYGESGQYPLAGRTLIFLLEIVELPQA